MKITNQALLVVVATTVLVACGSKEPVQSVDWYKTHDTERTAMVRRCNGNPGELADTLNCINAATAADAKTWASRSGVHDVKAPIFGKKPMPKG